MKPDKGMTPRTKDDDIRPQASAEDRVSRPAVPWVLRPVALFVPALAVAALAGCGGYGHDHDHYSGPSSFTVGGTVSGLSGTLVLQNNGGDDLTVSTNGPFTFATALMGGANYSITIAMQPSGATCTVSDGGGTVQDTVKSVLVECSAVAATARWTWQGGSNTIDAAGQYGTQAVASSSNAPGAREAPSAWTDANGNFWLFGGYGYANSDSGGLLNDLWEYEPSVGQWIWMGGADSLGSTGTIGTQGQPAAGNVPSAREAAATWTDPTGQLWLFGGLGDASGQSVQFNDLWRYQPTTGQWTWRAGPTTADGTGSYGTQGVAASSNVPPPRAYPITWVDSAGILWMFGGAQYDAQGVSALFNDLWSYNPTTNLWTWVGGSGSPNAGGSYGPIGNPASTNLPGARAAATAWVDASGDLWLLGGYGLDQQGNTGELNDLWRYSPNSGTWTWVAGAATANANGSYGTQGAAAASNAPGARVTASAWTDASGNFWLFGGYGYGQSGNA